MSDIFISYAREDRPRAEAIAKALEDHGWSVWWDRIIPAGSKFPDVIGEEIAKASCVLVLWSGISVTKDWVIEEASEGRERGILVPVFVERVQPPRGFRLVQAADLTDWQQDAGAPAFQRLCLDIDALIGKPKKVASAAVPAAEVPVPDPLPNQLTPAEPRDRIVSERKQAPSLFGRRGAIGGASLAALVCAGYLVSRLPYRKSASPTVAKPSGKNAQPPGAQTNPKDGLSYVWIEPGEFQMGENQGDADEKPRHRVRITKGFWMGETLVTVAAYTRFVTDRADLKMPPPPDFNSGWSKADHPIVRVTWDEAQAYCAWAGGTAGKLPTEASGNMRRAAARTA